MPIEFKLLKTQILTTGFLQKYPLNILALHWHDRTQIGSDVNYNAQKLQMKRILDVEFAAAENMETAISVDRAERKTSSPLAMKCYQCVIPRNRIHTRVI